MKRASVRVAPVAKIATTYRLFHPCIAECIVLCGNEKRNTKRTTTTCTATITASITTTTTTTTSNPAVVDIDPSLFSLLRLRTCQARAIRMLYPMVSRVSPFTRVPSSKKARGDVSPVATDVVFPIPQIPSSHLSCGNLAHKLNLSSDGNRYLLGSSPDISGRYGIGHETF